MAKELRDLKMRELYIKIELELDKVKYDTLWPGFSRMEFAIYNKETVFFNNKEIPYDERFLGNTSINYKGRNLAIIYVEEAEKENIQELASLIVHEMFHSYQNLNPKEFGRVDCPTDLEALDYPNDLENYKIKYRENKLIVEALNSRDGNTKADILRKIIGLRMLRLARYGDIIKYEFAIETLEGSAEYCGSKALLYISQEAYQKRIEDYKNILLKDISLLFDIRRISYYTGTLLLFLFEELDIIFTQETSRHSQYIFEEIADKIEYDSIDIGEIEEASLEEYYINHVKNIKEKFEDFFKGSKKKYEGDFIICGYDPMNMIKQKDEILCSHFIMLRDQLTKEQLFIQGPLLIKLKEGSYNHVMQYYL